MARHFKPLFCLFLFLPFLALFTVPAAADDMGAPMNAAAIVKAIGDNTTKLTEINTANTNNITDKLDEISGDLALAISIASQNNSTPDQDNDLAASLQGMPNGLVLLDTTRTNLLSNRLRELNLMSPIDVTGLTNGTTKADYLIDPQQNYGTTENPDSSADPATAKLPTGNTINAEVFDIFMRYFCDPDGRSGTMGSLLTQKGHLIESLRYAGKYIACGSVILDNGSIVMTGTGAASRDATLKGAEPSPADLQKLKQSTDPADAPKLLVEQNRDQIKNLPLKPGMLFFDTNTTVPVLPDKTDPDVTNTNPLAPVYYGAFAEALQFLVGVPDDLTDLPAVTSDPMGGGQATFIKAQGRIAKKMLASYPFVLLFTERLGTLDENVAKATGAMLSAKLGSSMSENDDLLANKILSLQHRKSMSLAEYMDIVMYQVPMSPGYLMRINSLDMDNLEREKVWLTAQQIVLNYQRNRWLEILAALEAVK